MSDDEPARTSEEQGHAGGTEEVHNVQRAVDDLRTASPTRDPPRPRPVRPKAPPEPVRERIRAELGEVAYVQHAYSSDEVHVCYVGIREEATIREDVVVAGEHGVATLDEVRARVDELRRGADPSDVAGLLSS